MIVDPRNLTRWPDTMKNTRQHSVRVGQCVSEPYTHWVVFIVGLCERILENVWPYLPFSDFVSSYPIVPSLSYPFFCIYIVLFCICTAFFFILFTVSNNTFHFSFLQHFPSSLLLVLRQISSYISCCFFLLIFLMD